MDKNKRMRKMFLLLKDFFKLFFKSKRKAQSQAQEKAVTKASIELYALDEYQLNNLLDKRIRFLFFSLEEMSKEQLLPFSYKKAELKTEEEVLSLVAKEDFSIPIVLICKKGNQSKALSSVLRDKGFINCYYLEKGFSSV